METCPFPQPQRLVSIPGAHFQIMMGSNVAHVAQQQSEKAQVSISRAASWGVSDTVWSRNGRQGGKGNDQARLQTTPGLRRKKKGGARRVYGASCEPGYLLEGGFVLAWGKGSADASNTFSGLRSQWTMFLKWRCRKATSIYKEDNHPNSFILWYYKFISGYIANIKILLKWNAT